MLSSAAFTLVLKNYKHDKKERRWTNVWLTFIYLQNKIRWNKNLLPDEHAGDDEAVQTQEAVQDVTQPRVVHRHRRLCGTHTGFYFEGQHIEVGLFFIIYIINIYLFL